MLKSVTKQGIINALTNLYDNFNENCKLPYLAETANHIWGKEIRYGIDENGKTLYSKEVQPVYATIHIPLSIGYEELENFLFKELPTLLKRRTADFFLDATGNAFNVRIAPQYILHYLNHWELMRDGDGQPIYATYNFDGKGYLDATFVRYMAITPNVDYKGPGLAEKGTAIPPFITSPRKKLYNIGINLETCYYAKDKEEAVRHFMQQLSEAVEEGRYSDYFTIEEG